MKHSALRWLLCACIVLTVLDSGLCVSRLFVDELTGYTTELVSADDVRTDLMIVNTQTVNGSVTANSTNSHTVDTPGSIGINTANTNFTINQNINIESFGENVKFTGDNIQLGAGTGDFVNNAIHTSLVADNVSLEGANFNVNGEHVKIKTPGEIEFSSNLNLNFNVEDKVQFGASQVSFEALGSTTINSEHSNVHFESGDSFSIDGSDLAFFAESGARILSQQDDLNIYSETLTTLLAENIRLDGISQSALISENGEISSESVNFNVESDRTVAGSDYIYLSSDDSDLTAISFGVIQSTSNSFYSQASTIDLTSSDQVKFSAGTVIDFVNAGPTTFTSDTSSYYAYRDATFLSSLSTLTVALTGGADLVSVDGDYTINSPNSINFDSFNTEVNGIETFSLSSFNLDVVATSYIDFLADGDVNITTQIFSITTNEFEIFARESAQLSATGAAAFTSNINNLNVESTANIIIAPKSGLFSDTADSILFDSLSQLYIQSRDDISFTASVSTLLQTRGGIIFEGGRDYDVNADTVNMEALNTNIYTSQLTIDSYSALFTTSSIGEFGMTTKSSIGDILLTASGPSASIAFQAIGDIAWSSQSNIQFTLAQGFDFIGHDVVLSAEHSILFSGDNLLFAAPTIYGLIQSDFEGRNAINFVGSTFFIAPTSRTNEVFVNSPDQNFDFFTGDISGGAVTIQNDLTQIFTETTLTIDSHNEKDITFDTGYLSVPSSTVISFDFGYIDTNSNTWFSNSLFLSITANDLLSYYSSGTFVHQIVSSLTINSDLDIFFDGDYGIVNRIITGGLNAAFGSEAEFNASNTNAFTAAVNFNITAERNLNLKAPQNTLQSTQQSLSIQSDTDIHSIYHIIDMQLASDMSISGQTGFTIDATNNVRMLSNSDILINSPSGILAEGGDIYVQGDVDLTLSNLGDITIGSNVPTIASPNYHTVEVSANSIVGTSTGPFDIYASGNDEYFDEAIEVTAGTFSLNSAGDYYVNGNNGINVDYDTITVTSSNFVYFVAENGDITVTSQGTAPALSIQGTVDSVAFVAYDAGLSQIAFDEIDHSATTSFTSSVLEGSKIKTLYDHSDVNVVSTNGVITETIGGDLTISNGNAQSITGDLSIAANSQVNITSTTGNLRFHSLDHDENSAAIQFAASNTLSADINSQYEVAIANAINYYPAGDVLVTGVAATFTASNGYYSFGTTQGDSSFTATTLNFNAQHDYNVTAGGVNGDIVSNYGSSAYTAGANYNVKSNSSTAIESTSQTLSATAGRHVKFTTFSEETGVYGAAHDVTFQSTATTGNTGVNVTGHALTISSSTSTNALTTKFTIGQNNAQFNPQINGHVNSWHVSSIGTNQITANFDDIKIDSGDFVSNAGTNSIIQAGGFLEFATTWDSLIPGDGILSVSADVGQITATALNYIDYHVRRNGVIHSDGRAQILSSGTSTSSPSTSGILFRGTNGNVAFNSLTTFSEDVTTTTLMDIGDDGVVVQADQNIALTASTGYTSLKSDGNIYSNARLDTAISTTGNNARMEFSTTGKRAPIAIHGQSITIDSVVDGIEFNGDTIVQFTSGDHSITTGSNNNGQLVFDSSSDLVMHSDLNLSMNTQRDFFIDAIGVGSDFEIQTAQTLSIHTDLDSTFSTVPSEGGSIRFTLDDNEHIDVTGNAWVIDSDADLNVNSNGTFAFSTGGRFETSVTGYIDINSNHSLYLRSTDNAQPADIVFHADNGDVEFGSVQSTNFVAGANGYGNVTFVIDGDSYFTAHGNFSGSSTSSLLIESLIGDSVYNSLLGDLDVQAYERLSLLAFGAATDTGYIKFVSRSPSQNENGIVIESTHTGGDIYMTGIGAVYAASDISFVAKGNTSETGYISIVNDWSSGKGDAGTTAPTTVIETEDYPSVKFDSGTQTLIRSDTGDIDVNYGRRLLLRGGSVSALATGAIQFDTRGQNRIISPYGNLDLYNQPSSFDITQFNVLTFRTENLGQGEIRVVAESSNVRALTEITLIRNNVDQLLVQGSSATVLRSRPNSQFPGIVFNSYDYLSITAFDDDILQYGRVIRYGVLNNVGSLLLESHANTDTLDYFHSVGNTNIVTDNYFVGTNGNVDIISENAQSYTVGGTLTMVAADNVKFYYAQTLTLTTTQTQYFQTIPESEPTFGLNSSFKQKIQFNGILSNVGYKYPQQSYMGDYQPVVTFDTDLYINYPIDFRNNDYFYNEDFQRGGACLYERAIVFGHSQGVRNVCICLDGVFLCNEDDYSYSNNLSNYPYKYYKEPYQAPYFGTGPK